MSLGDITKQFAVQALTGPDKPATPEQTGAVIFAQLQAIQKKLKEEEELVLLFRSGAETIVVREVYFPTWDVAVLSGVDPNKSTTRVISPVGALQLVCKVARVQPGAKAFRVGLIAPRP
jgi:hypothetical protein